MGGKNVGAVSIRVRMEGWKSGRMEGWMRWNVCTSERLNVGRLAIGGWRFGELGPMAGDSGGWNLVQLG
jgi:hypothetical protein